jgi:cytoskeletal protein RodZ
MTETKETPAQPGEVGVRQEPAPDLKAVREARGLTLQDIFLATRVSMVNLTAVEHQAFDQLPPSVYARDFIRKYARTIGVDEKPILARYDQYRVSLNPPPEEAEVQKPWPESGRRHRFLIVSLATLLAAGILVYILFLYDQSGRTLSPVSSSATPAATPEQSAAPVSGAVEASRSPEPVAAPSAAGTAASATAAAVKEASPAAPVAGKMYHLVIETREPTWIRITEDGASRYEVMLKPGDKIERMASEYFQLDIGNAGGINLVFQGKPLGELGKRGQIIHMRLPEQPATRTP